MRLIARHRTLVLQEHLHRHHKFENMSPTSLSLSNKLKTSLHTINNKDAEALSLDSNSPLILTIILPLINVSTPQGLTAFPLQAILVCHMGPLQDGTHHLVKGFLPPFRVNSTHTICHLDLKHRLKISGGPHRRRPPLQNQRRTKHMVPRSKRTLSRSQRRR